MTREDAVRAMKNGEKVTHRNFIEEEWCEFRDGGIYTEDGYHFSECFYKRDMFSDGWRIK